MSKDTCHVYGPEGVRDAPSFTSAMELAQALAARWRGSSDGVWQIRHAGVPVARVRRNVDTGIVEVKRLV